MTFGSAHWVEVGDEWWIYYAGWDGPHGTKQRNPGIGLAKLRKEGFISLEGPEHGGVVSTRQLQWPGGNLIVNANATNGELKVRVTNAARKVIPGFGYKDCTPFTGNETGQTVTWKEQSLDSLKGQIVRFEFYLENADLYTFRAESKKQIPTLIASVNFPNIVKPRPLVTPIAQATPNNLAIVPENSKPLTIHTLVGKVVWKKS